MSAPAIIREADLRRMARVVRKEGVDVRLEFQPDGRMSLLIGPGAKPSNTQGNGFDEALG